MAEANKDPAIKLFGRTISLSRHNTEVSANDSPYDDDDDHSTLSPSSSDPRELSYETQHEAEKDKESSRKKLTSLQDDEVSNQTTEDPKSPTSSSCPFVNTKIPSSETEDSIVKSSKNNNGTQNETSVSQNDKASPKKPEKILPCPRCSSMDTKFCYFNNYNVNQPRHFCKSCQRYWTAGGTMRNVPVGAGRRKNKNTSNNSSSCSDSFSCASSYRQVIVPEAIQRGMLDPPLCNSIPSVLSLAEKTEQNDVQNVFHAPKQKYTFVTPTSSDKNMGHSGSHELVEKGYQFNLPLWPYPWNTTIHSPHAFCQNGYPVSFYAKPTHYFATPPQSCADHFAPSFGPNSPTLGKHSREGNMLPPISSQKDKVAKESSKNSENGVVMLPKTLKIDDSCEAAMSSVWSTLRIKNDMAKSLKGGGIFKGYPTKGHNNNFHVVEASPVLQANPAALSRSLIFHEST